MTDTLLRTGHLYRLERLVALRQARVDLLAARGSLEEYGWRKGGYGAPETGFCAAGAIMKNIPALSKAWRTRRDEAEQALFFALPMRYRERAYEKATAGYTLSNAKAEAIWDYNDRMFRTKGQVIRRFDKAIKMLGERIGDLENEL